MSWAPSNMDGQDLVSSFYQKRPHGPRIYGPMSQLESGRVGIQAQGHLTIKLCGFLFPHMAPLILPRETNKVIMDTQGIVAVSLPCDLVTSSNPIKNSALLHIYYLFVSKQLCEISKETHYYHHSAGNYMIILTILLTSLISFSFITEHLSCSKETTGLETKGSKVKSFDFLKS